MLTFYSAKCHKSVPYKVTFVYLDKCKCNISKYHDDFITVKMALKLYLNTFFGGKSMY